MPTSGIPQTQKCWKHPLVKVLIVLVVLSIPFILKAQPVGANMSNPVVIGNYAQGTYSYTDTKNNSTSYGYLNDIGNASDDIYYRLTVQGTSTINISLCGATFDTYLHLLSSTGAVIATNDDNGPLCSGLQSSIQTTIAPGTYYIVAEGYGSAVGSLPISVNSIVQAPPAPVVYDTRNFIRVWDATSPQTNPNTLMTVAVKDAKQSTQYFDGLGRPEQTVIKNGSLSDGVYGDVISPVVYDEFGRETQKFLPYVSASVDGLYKANPLTEQNSFYLGTTSPISGQGETFFYGKTDYEPSPLNRPLKTYAPGNSWVGASRGTEAKYWINTITDAVRIWNVDIGATGNFSTYTSPGAYPPDQLYKNVSVDEAGKQVLEFKDKEGKVILKKVQLTALADDGIIGSGHDGWLCTYYIYDDLGNLRCVIQPEGVKTIQTSWVLDNTNPTILSEQCFRYEYDQRNRMIMKKVPGAKEVYMVYDARDRMVMTQDANTRLNGKWMVTIYDDLNRPVQTGLLTNATTLFTTHLNAAYGSSSYPVTTSNFELLTVSHYDDYTALPAGLSSAGYLSDWNSNFSITDNINYPYPQLPVAVTSVKGLVTWVQTKILGTASTFINTALYYDDKGWIVQNQSTNITGGLDVITTQYNWSGQPLVRVQKHEKAGTPIQNSIVITQTSYDVLGRVAKVEKKLSNSLVNNNGMSAYKTIAEMQYDALGKLKKKKVGNKPLPAPAGTPLANLDYEYNIRGWLLSLNKSYVEKDKNFTNTNTSDQYFGMQLGYDKNGSYGAFTSLYNGNISGTIWKGEGDQEKRKYDFNYDPANRLTGAVFSQHVSGTGVGAMLNTSAGVDFGVENLNYDANGNMLSMWQKGLKLNVSAYIDKLAYNYYPNSNKLLNVIDAVNDATTKLGDFRASYLYQTNTPVKTATTADYGYDDNGNLVNDNNKDLGSPIKDVNGIIYNHLNLPTQIDVRKPGASAPEQIKGSIVYTYDAAGNKLRKVTTDKGTAGLTITTTTNYINGFVYETKTTIPTDINNPDYVDLLQFTGHEEGRIRFKPASGSVVATLPFDYFIKDHLGNVRMVLTEEQQTNIYPAATLEGTFTASGITPQANSMINTEKQFYNIDNSYVYNESTPSPFIASWLPETPVNKKLYYNNNGPANINYPNGCTPLQTNESNKLYKLNATTNKTGLEFSIKVMAGDKIDIFGRSYFFNTTDITNSNSTALDLLTLMTNLVLSPSNAAAGKGLGGKSLRTINSNQDLSSFFRGGNSEPATKIPKAYINYIFLDEQFKFAGGGASRVGNIAAVDGGTGIVKDHWNDDLSLRDITVPKNGYIFVYVSNESNLDVYFDNLQVIHKPGPILEETHYYPFGLTMSGISSKAAGKLENKTKYNGMELQSKEFSDGLGLELYEYKYRFYDQQIGRFISQDRLADKYPHYSPYQFAGNQVPNAIDLDGLEEFRVNQKDGYKDVTLVRVNAPFSVQYNGQQLAAFPQQNMNDYYQNNVVVKNEANGRGTNSVSSVTTYGDNGNEEQIFYDNVVGTKEIARDLPFRIFLDQPDLPTTEVTTEGTLGAVVTQSNSMDNPRSNSTEGTIGLGQDLIALNFSSMGTTPSTFAVTTTNPDNVRTTTNHTGTQGVGNPVMIAVAPKSKVNVTVVQGAADSRYSYIINVVDTTKPTTKTLPHQ